MPHFRRKRLMSNRAIWDVRKRHEWLQTPLKGKRIKRRKRLRLGMEGSPAGAQDSDQSAAGKAES